MSSVDFTPSRHYSRSLEKPILLFQAKESKSLGPIHLELIRSGNRMLLISDSVFEARRLIEQFDPEIVFYNATTPWLQVYQDIAALAAQEPPSIGRKQITLSDDYQTLQIDELQALGVDDFWLIHSPQEVWKNRLQKALVATGSQRRLALVEKALNASRASILISDPHKKDCPIVYANDCFEKVTGYSLAEALDRNCRFLQGQDKLQPNLELLRQSIREGKPCSVLLRNYRKNGELFWNELDIAPIHNKHGDLEYLVGLQYDLTAHVVPLHLSEASESKIKQVLETSPSFIWLLQTPKNWTYLNQTARNFIGSNRAANWSAAVHPDDMPVLIDTLEKAWQNPYSVRCEIRVQTAQGSLRTVQHTFITLFSAEGEPEMIIGSGVDITEFQQAEKVLEDRQRYMTALSLLQKAILSQKMDEENFLSIAAQALDALSFEVMIFPEGLDAQEIRAKLPLIQNNSLAERLVEHSTVIHALEDGQSTSLLEGKGKLFLYPVIKQAKTAAVFGITHQENREFGRTELDFLRNLGQLLFSTN